MDTALRDEINYLLYGDGDETPESPATLSLEGEISAAREVLAGLLALWRQEAESRDEARKLAALLFSGARTIAILLAHQSRLGAPEVDNDWMMKALEEMEREG